ncbi:hypothetical protein ILUMI_08325 [Ignelater luminosus]|uniref:Uncharacterized protein n=1 Tax=Ignelater luminosus TaxID=2038154 RepID=A0A8K0D253_IGNLU|nr:hypothetical protein ILUMI_08325 [Ignelater luminosus]
MTRVVCLIILVGVIKITELLTIQDNNVTESTSHDNISGNFNFTFNDTHINKTEVVKVEKSAPEEITNDTVKEEYSHSGNDSVRQADKNSNQTNAESEEDSDEDPSMYPDRIGCNCLQTLQG